MRFLKMPRWLLILEGLLLLVALLVLAYKARMRILPLPVKEIQEKRAAAQKEIAKTTVQDYYRQYPERYIHLEDKGWLLHGNTGIALHSFTLRNQAPVAYTRIEVRFTYESLSGTARLTRDVQIQGTLAPKSSRSFSEFQVTGVPAAAKHAVAVVKTAAVLQ